MGFAELRLSDAGDAAAADPKPGTRLPRMRREGYLFEATCPPFGGLDRCCPVRALLKAFENGNFRRVWLNIDEFEFGSPR